MSHPYGQVVRQFFEEAFNKGNLSVIDKLFTPDFTVRHPEPGYGADLETFKAMTAEYRKAFPDLRMTIEDELVDGDKVAIRFTACGTHLGPMGDIPPTGKAVQVRGMAIYQFENGRIAQDWVEYDQLGMLRQLGLLPAQ